MSNQKIQRLNKFMSLLTTILIVALPLGCILFWMNFPETAQSLAIAEHKILQPQNIEFVQVIVAAGFSFFSVLVLVYGLWHLRSLFQCFMANQSFSNKATHSLYRFTTVLFVSSLLKIASPILMSVVLTWNNPENQKALVVQFGSQEFSMLFIAATFWAIAWTFKEGQRLAIENQEFV